MKFATLALLLTAGLASSAVPGAVTTPFSVHINVDASKATGELIPVWRFFGADEPNYATMPNGQKLMGELGALDPNRVYFRAHNLLTSGDGTPALKWGSTGAYTEDPQGNPSYHWTILDGIFDTYRRNGVRPYVEIGFMPEALSLHPEPYQHHWTPEAKYNAIFTGWAYPPKDYRKWDNLVFEWAKHCLERYGEAEVQSWYWEVWNEPNIGYWQGTPQEFFKLHDCAVDGLRRALPSARAGGPDCAGSGGRFLRAFLEHCLHGTNYATGEPGTPLDFVSFHAKGAPTVVNGHVRMGIAAQLRTIADGFRIINSFPELKAKPVIIGECDPEGCAACQGGSLAYRNGTMYPSYTAACLAREYELASQYGVNLQGALTWAFEFENQPWFAGFRSLASNGVDKPILNLFRMLALMQGRKIQAASDHSASLPVMLNSGVRTEPEVAALATLAPRALCVLVWHYHDDELPGPDANVELSLHSIPPVPGDALLQHFRIDSTHSNAFTAWQRMGSPQQPTVAQYAELENAGQLQPLQPPESVQIQNGSLNLKFALPRQAVSLLKLTW